MKKKIKFKVYNMKFTRNELDVIRIAMKVLIGYSDNKHCIIPAEFIKSKIEKKLKIN